MTHTIQQSHFLSSFQCTGDACPDTCCKGWNMQLDAGMRAKYEASAPELLSATVSEGDGFIMKRDAETDYCVKFEGGLCGIHKTYGDEFLGDACHFYPRVTRALGDITLMTATPSCPEVSRLALFSDAPFARTQGEVPRVPYSLKNYLPESLSPAQALAVHEAFLLCVEEAESVEVALARISSVARSMQHLPEAAWPEAVPMYLRMADGRLPAAEAVPEDPFNLLHALAGLAVASRKKRGPRLMETVSAMEQALAATLDWENVSINLTEHSAQCYATHRATWDEGARAELNDVLKRWLMLQISVALFPFSGLGGNCVERITIIGVRFCTFRLALMCERGMSDNALPQDVVVRIAQSLARVLDHLADPVFSLQVYQEVGWIKEARMLGLLTN